MTFYYLFYFGHSMAMITITFSAAQTCASPLLGPGSNQDHGCYHDLSCGMATTSYPVSVPMIINSVLGISDSGLTKCRTLREPRKLGRSGM
ncbi:hypothetical protein F4604DRAFT_1748956, partial [Suillus subluteus]